MSIATNLPRLAGMHGYTHTEVAKAIGMSENGMTNIVRGHSEPSLKTALKLAAFFGVSIEQLMGSTKDCLYASLEGHELPVSMKLHRLRKHYDAELES